MAVQVRGLLVKLQAVFNLPKRLQTAIDQGAVEIAVNAYADAAPLLKRYGHKVGGSLISAGLETSYLVEADTRRYLPVSVFLTIHL